MKKILLAVVTMSLILSCSAYAADKEDADYKERVKEAKLCLKASPPQDLVNQALEGLSKNPQVQLTPADLAAIKSSIDYAVLEKAMQEALVKNFTIDELKMMTQFFGSVTGQSIMHKMPLYMGDIRPVLQQQIQGHVVDYLKAKKQQGGGMSVAPMAPAAPAAPAAAPATAPEATPVAPAPAAPAAAMPAPATTPTQH